MLGLMSPGPNILAVIGTSVGVNRKAGISLALGVSAGALLWGLLTCAGLTVLLAAARRQSTSSRLSAGFISCGSHSRPSAQPRRQIAVLSLVGHLLYALAFSTQRMITIYR
jgi:hypothetical protein